MQVITGQQVLLSANDTPGPHTIEVCSTTGRIIAIHPRHALRTDYANLDANAFVDAADLLVMPGVVDAHVHVNEPGRTAWEGFETATYAAAAGGVTTLVDMPLNAIPPTTTPHHFATKLDAAKEQCWIDVGFYGGLVPDNADSLKDLVNLGVRGFKCFMIESGVDEFPMVTESDIRRGLEQLQGTDIVMMFHAEMEHESEPISASGDETHYSTFLASRPTSLECRAIETVIRLCREFKTVKCHIVHLSAADALPMIRAAKKEGLPLTVETCFHYLTLSAEQIPTGATQFKCCPPIRDDTNRQLLWEALADGTIDFVVSDHSPCVAELKRLDQGDFMKAWGGIASLQFGLPLLWTEALKRGHSVQDLVRWLSTHTAKHASLFNRKGSLAVGKDADIVIWDPKSKFTITQDTIRFKNKVTPYMNQSLNGRIHRTIVRGKTVYLNNDSNEAVAKRIGMLLV
ncbi:allantoinase [Syncephalis fuscata]|nr:allantoinase [Syncephalis fuscata]